MIANLNPKYVKYASDDPAGKRTFKYLISDSRSVFDPENTLFVAIKTKIGDGTKYIRELYSKGVKAFIVEKIPTFCADIDATFYVVEDIPQSLADIACERIAGNVNGVIVTGSVGKTTTKELIYRALLSFTDVRRSPRSWNSSIGVPMSIWDMTQDAPKNIPMISEAGIDGPGQASLLRNSLKNTHHIGVLTPITNEHDEAFESHEAKVLEKLALLQDCHTIIYDGQDAELGKLVSTFSNPSKNLIPVSSEGFPSIFHALAAAAVKALGYPVDNIGTLPMVSTRREIVGAQYGNTVIYDRFTPDLRSLREALDFMRRQSSSNHPSTLVLGNLLHPEGMSAEDVRTMYKDAFSVAKAFGAKKVFCVATELNDLPQDNWSEEGVVLCGDNVDLVAAQYLNGTLCNNEQILLFGLPDDEFKNLTETMESASHDGVLEVDLDAIAHNYNYFRSLIPHSAGLVAMVKASAYGLGSVEIGKCLQSLGASYLAVAVIEEGIALRDAGITMPVMVLNPVTNRYPALFGNKLEPAVFSPEELERLIHEAESYGVTDYPIHIKLDTGMHRVGFIESQLDIISEMLASTEAVKVASVLSHLATADCLDKDDYTLEQIDNFVRMTDKLENKIGYRFKRHILNTAGMMRFANSCSYELGRLGIGLYGISPVPEMVSQIKPVATLRSRIISLKHWPAGTPIGYGCRGVTTRDSIIATVPMGYADGINRHFGRGAASFTVNGTQCPTIGNICMDQCMVDVTDAPNVKVGDDVYVFGKDLPVERLSDILDTIPYEILTSVSPRVKRVYTKK